MSNIVQIEHKELKELVQYIPLTGDFYWKKSKGSRKKNTKAGCLHHDGYIKIRIDGKLYRAHRLAWYYIHAEWPTEIDHINRVRNDNRYTNLRQVSRKENTRNSSIRVDNTTGTTGVYWSKQKNKWIAKLNVDGTDKYLGSFWSKAAATAARKEAEARLWA